MTMIQEPPAAAAAADRPVLPSPSVPEVPELMVDELTARLVAEMVANPRRTRV